MAIFCLFLFAVCQLNKINNSLSFREICKQGGFSNDGNSNFTGKREREKGEREGRGNVIETLAKRLAEERFKMIAGQIALK